MWRNELLWPNDCIILTFYSIYFLRLFPFTTLVKELFWFNLALSCWLKFKTWRESKQQLIISILANSEWVTDFCKCRACFAAKNSNNSPAYFMNIFLFALIMNFDNHKVMKVLVSYDPTNWRWEIPKSIYSFWRGCFVLIFTAHKNLVK